MLEIGSCYPRRMEDQPPITASISVNLADMFRIAQVGVWRASAFLKIGLHDLHADHHADFDLSGGVQYRFWPSPLPRETAEAAVDEYRHWLIGSCLKELDQFFSLFLDRAWWVIEAASLHNQRVASDHMFDQKFAGTTNVATKIERVAAAVGFIPELECFHSLSLARNALTHGAGRVRNRDCNEENGLLLTWVAAAMVIKDGDREIVWRDRPADTYQVEDPGGAAVLLRFDRQYARFGLGEKIELSHENLAEICWFYQQQASLVHNQILEHLRQLGIVDNPAGPDAHDENSS